MSPPEAAPVQELEDSPIPGEPLLNRFDDILALPSGDNALQGHLLSHYAALKIQQFWQYGREDDLAEAVAKASQAVENTTDGDAEYAERLDLFGVILESLYERLGQLDHLETAIQLSRRAVEATPAGHPDLAAWLNNLGNKLQGRFERTGRMEDLEEAIQVARRAVDITPADHPDLAAWLSNLGSKLERRFERTGRMDDLEEAIEMARQAVDMTPADHPDLAAWLSNLGNKLERRFERTGRMDDLEEAIQVARRAVDMTPADHPDLAARLSNLGSKLERRFERTGRMDDLKEAIEVARRAVDMTPADHPDLAARLSNLGSKLQGRFERTGRMEDLEEAIEMARRAVDVNPPDHPDLAALLNNLGSKLQRRFERTGRMDDLEEAIEVARRAVDMTPADHPDLAAWLSNLGNKLESRFERTGRMDDLEEAIEMARQAVDMTPADHPDLAAWLSNLGNKLERRFERTGRMDDLEEAIEMARQAVDMTPADHPDLAARLSNLGNKLESRFERTGRMDDLEEAIQVARRAVDATPPDHPDLAAWLSNLGTKLERRFERTGRMDDLEEAIEMARRAVDVNPPDHPDLAALLNNLGSKLQGRFERTGRMEDLEEAIQVARRAVDVTPADHPDLAAWLNNLGNKLQGRFERTGRMDDLEEAIQVARRAVDMTPADHPNLAARLSSLGSKLERRFERTGRMDDLKEAIQVARRAVDMTPADHPDLAARLNNLGNMLLRSQPPENEEALQRFLQAWNCDNSIPFHRLNAAVQAITLLKQKAHWALATQIATDVAHLLPLVNNRSLGRDDQRHIVSQFFGIASDVGALVLQNGGDAFDALELLELTRGSIVGLLMDDRSDISVLQRSHPELAIEYERLRTEVNAPVQENEDSKLARLRATRRLEAVRELHQCIDRIRTMPGHQRFLKGPSRKELQDWAAEGPIVVVNVNDIRSDAIIVTQTGVQSIPLVDLTLEETTSWLRQDLTIRKKHETDEDRGKKNKRYLEFLHWLWEKCVRQVMLSIHDGVKPAPGHLSRIWWIGVGMASSLPFHVAGDHSVDSTDNTLSWAISSYTPTIKALTYARVRQSTLRRDHRDRPPKPHLLMVSMPTTPGEGKLPGVMQEMSVVQTVTRPAFSNESLVHPDARSVLQRIRHCDVVHFACHGMSDTLDPFQSCLVLQRGPSDTATADPLRVQQILEINLGRASIAYLSACSTAENRIEQLMDEVIHLASGFQVAGFGHVVAAMWPSVDEVCVEMARGFYGRLPGGMGGGITDRGVAEAVHEASVQVRARWRKMPLWWAPYVHVGA